MLTEVPRDEKLTSSRGSKFVENTSSKVEREPSGLVGGDCHSTMSLTSQQYNEEVNYDL